MKFLLSGIPTGYLQFCLADSEQTYPIGKCNQFLRQLARNVNTLVSVIKSKMCLTFGPFTTKLRLVRTISIKVQPD